MESEELERISESFDKIGKLLIGGNPKFSTRYLMDILSWRNNIRMSKIKKIFDRM